ncbi:transporter [Hymenobacter lapidiphilus]|uniref:transporter n=1 Tax=Hymenobacter sp. CCM 8763 TaxID=2303334 RepID=UPI000E34930E|nr:transporter [Hymenobacter sp. CCM 8763]RFP67089.1 transporter [Hymenobacter sp. CCM 8763]
MRLLSPTLLAAALLLPLLAAAQAPTDSLTAVKSRYSLFRPVPRELMRDLAPDRPGVTESPFSVDAGHFQFETALANLISSHPNRQPKQYTFRANAFVLKMGIDNRTDVQLFIDAYEWDRTFATADEPGTRNQGFGDITVRLKRNLLGNDSTESPLAVAAIGFVRLPTGGRQGAGGYEYGLLLPATYALADTWNLSAQLPLLLNFDRDENQHYLQTAPSVNLDHAFRPWLTGFGELVAQHDFRARRWDEAINAGAVFSVGKNMQFDIGRQFALTGQADREYFVGFAVRR